MHEIVSWADLGLDDIYRYMPLFLHRITIYSEYVVNNNLQISTVSNVMILNIHVYLAIHINQLIMFLFLLIRVILSKGIGYTWRISQNSITSGATPWLEKNKSERAGK